MADRDDMEDVERDLEHHTFCSAASWPCPLKCETWEPVGVEHFPSLDQWLPVWGR